MYTNLKEKNYHKVLIAGLIIIYLTICYFCQTYPNAYFSLGMAFFGLSFIPLIIYTYIENEFYENSVMRILLEDKKYAVVVTNKFMEVLYKNKPAVDMFGDLLPLNFIEKYIIGEDIPALLKIRASFLGHFNTETTLNLKLKNNTFTALRVTTKAIDENIFAWIVKDISPDFAILDTMDKEVKFLSNITGNIPAMLCITDVEGKIRYTNQAFLNDTGYSEDEIIGINIGNICNLKIHNLTIKNDETIKFITKNNETVDFLTSRSMHTITNESFVYISGIKAVFCENNDMSLSKNNKVFQKLFTESPIGIVFCTNWGDIIDANFAMQTMLKLKDPLGSSILNYITLADRSYFLSRLEKMTILGNETYPAFNVEMLADPYDDTLKPISVLVYITPKRNENDEIEGAVLHFIDVTEEKQTMAQLQAIQSEQTMTKITSGIAHDVNNRIATIQMSADLLMMGKTPADTSYIEAVKISEGVKRVKETISSLLFRSKQQESKKDYTKVDKIVSYYHKDYIRSILNPDIKDKITIIVDKEYATDLGYLRVDLNQIYNSIDNLIINASDAMSPNGGELYFKISNETIQKSFEYHIYNTIERVMVGEYILIEVADTGCGIEEENLSKIFDHYYTTKKGMGFKNSGSGIGLSIVYGTIRQSEGYIMVQSKIGAGTSFKILLPKVTKLPSHLIEKEKQESSEKVKTAKKKTNKKEQQLSFEFDIKNEEKEKAEFRNSALAIAEESGTRVLLIEDNDDIRFLAGKIISNLGYEVVACDCAESANDTIKTDKNFKLMLSDVMMPGMSGLEFLKIIKKEIPNLKVILMSGYSEGLINEEVTEGENLKIISKPFSVAELSKKIKDLIGTK